MDHSYSILKLQGKVQHYQWGGVSFLPELLGINNFSNQHYAEYWLGVHPLGAADVLIDDQAIPLQQLIDQDPIMALSEPVQRTFGTLPYLMKVMDVQDTLSIQVHPTKEKAIAGFAKEDEIGIARNATNRNYKDTNHKPEVILAISEFWLLHGFKDHSLLEKILSDIFEFQILLPLYKKEGLQALYRFIMEMDQDVVNNMLLPLVKREIRNKNENLLSKHDAGWWVAKYFGDKNPVGNIDRGIFSIYLFNIVQLQPGEAIFQGAGIPHAFLEGQNVELMANSDNVLRGGLTNKHIDVPELLANMLFQPTKPQILKGTPHKDGETVFQFPVPDFSLNHLQLDANASFESKAIGPEIWVVLEGGVIINNQMVIKKGESFIIFPNQPYQFHSSGKSVLCKGFVPLDNAY